MIERRLGRQGLVQHQRLALVFFCPKSGEEKPSELTFFSNYFQKKKNLVEVLLEFPMH
jgi:hypothetical protein